MIRGIASLLLLLGLLASLPAGVAQASAGGALAGTGLPGEEPARIEPAAVLDPLLRRVDGGESPTTPATDPAPVPGGAAPQGRRRAARTRISPSPADLPRRPIGPWRARAPPAAIG